MKITVGVSNRHVHLRKEDCDILFGKDYELTHYADLKQPGQYASGEFVILKTPKSTIEKVRVLGPFRNYSQVEISQTDSYKLGLKPPVRDSGEIENSEKITLIGPKGEIEIEGCIIARRHLHINKEEKELYNLPDVVKIKVLGERGGMLDNVFVKVADPAFLELHLDTDEANGLGIKNGNEVEIIID